MNRALVAALLCVIGCTRTPKPPDAGVAEWVRDAIVAKIPDATVEIRSPSQLVVKKNEPPKAPFFIVNLKIQCATKESCHEQIDQTVASIADSLESEESTARVEDVFPNIETTAGIERFNAMIMEKTPAKFDENRIVSREFTGELVVDYVVSNAMHRDVIKRSQQKTLGLDDEALDALARKNLAEKYERLIETTEMSRVVMTNVEPDAFAASLMLLPDIWRPLEKKLGAPLLIAVPSHERFYAISGASDPRALAEFKRFAAFTHAQQSSPLSPLVFRLGANGFREWKQ